LFGNAPQVAGTVEDQVAVGELAVRFIEGCQRAQRTAGRILPHDAVAKRAALIRGPKEIAAGVERDTARRVDPVGRNGIAVEAD
jgi:hypothetical protein